jgi:serine/threonine-protein kinase ULK/ATG1
MEYCAGGDLTHYIKKRGRVEGLEFVPTHDSPPQYYPHPRTGGLDEIVVRSFLRQLGMFSCHNPNWLLILLDQLAL